MTVTRGAISEEVEAEVDARAIRKGSHRRLVPLVGYLAVLLIVGLLPTLLPGAQVPIAHQVLLAIPSALALNLVMGIAGQVSLATSAMLAAGAFTVGLMTHSFTSTGLVTNMVLAAVVGFALGIVVGLPSVRIRGLYLLIATLAFQAIVQFFTQRIQSKEIGPQGFVLPLPQIPLVNYAIVSPLDWYYVLLVYAVLILGVCAVVSRSNVGRAWRAVRKDELTATSLGVNVRAAKLSAFAISSAIIAMTGALVAYYQSIVTYDAFTLPIAIQYVAMIIVGGMGSLVGATVGAVLLTILPFLLTGIVHAITPDSTIVFNLELIIYGVAIIFFLRVAPGGLISLIRRLGALLGRTLSRTGGMVRRR